MHLLKFIDEFLDSSEFPRTRATIWCTDLISSNFTKGYKALEGEMRSADVSGTNKPTTYHPDVEMVWLLLNSGTGAWSALGSR